MSKEKKQKQRKDENIIYVGKKPIMKTANTAQILFNKFDTVILKARGMRILGAIDISELLMKKLMKDRITREEIVIDTEEGINKERRRYAFSTICITLKKQ